MSCPSCGSLNLAEFPTEMLIHPGGPIHLSNPGVWVFPKVLVCLDCGYSRFNIPEAGLRPLGEASARSAAALLKLLIVACLVNSGADNPPLTDCPTLRAASTAAEPRDSDQWAHTAECSAQIRSYTRLSCSRPNPFVLYPHRIAKLCVWATSSHRCSRRIAASALP